MDPRKRFVDGPSAGQNHQRLDSNQVQAPMNQILEHLQVEMRHSQAMQAKGANRAWVAPPIIQEGFRECLDA